MLARRFLWIIAGITMIVIVAGIAYSIFQQQLFRAYFVPTAAFQEVPVTRSGAGGDYADASMWIARPDIPNNPALWDPPGLQPTAKPQASVFFIHPTSYLGRDQWNAPVDDADALGRAELFVRHQASPFNGVAAIWAPKYRQAAFGAFLTTKGDAEKALDFAYKDVVRAFGEFLKEAPGGQPIILAAHSQGSYHLVRLLHELVAGTPIAKRVVAAYVIGWPISTTADLDALGLPACDQPDQANCILSWQSFAEPADPEMVTRVYDSTTGFNGQPRTGSPMLCINPLTGTRGGEAPAKANLGTLFPNDALTNGTLEPGVVPARCDVGGFLLIGSDKPNLPPYVLPGNNYHVFDYALFWANIRADAERRLKAYLEPASLKLEPAAAATGTKTASASAKKGK